MFSFSQIQIFEDIEEQGQNKFGQSISLSSNGKIIAIGAPEKGFEYKSRVEVYKNVEGEWLQIGDDIYKEGDSFGIGVSLSENGDIVAVAANDCNGMTGYVSIYKNVNDNWSQMGSSISGDAFATTSNDCIALSSSGNIISIGTRGDNNDDNDSGKVRVFRYNNNDWEQIGNDLNGDIGNDLFGSSVSMSSDASIVAIGVPDNSDSGLRAGLVRVYKNIDNNWVQLGEDIKGDPVGNKLGSSVSLSSDGDIIAMGASSRFTFDQAYVRVCKYTSDNWVQIGNDILAPSISHFGDSVSLSADGSVLAVGAPEDTGSSFNRGFAKIYQNVNDEWIQRGIDIKGDNNEDLLGASVSLSSDGSIVAIGAPHDYLLRTNKRSIRTGYVRFFDLSSILSANEYVLSEFSLFPNPTNSEFTIELKDDLLLEKIILYNNTGQKVMTADSKVISTNHLSKGNYFVEIHTNKGKTTKKIVVK